ncbi:MAG: hypothetical protein WB773_12820 [Isosphaeraceae bacterium]
MPTEAEIWAAMHGAIPRPASPPVPAFRGAVVDTDRLDFERQRRAGQVFMQLPSTYRRIPMSAQAPTPRPRLAACPRCAVALDRCVCSKLAGELPRRGPR